MSMESYLREGLALGEVEHELCVIEPEAGFPVAFVISCEGGKQLRFEVIANKLVPVFGAVVQEGSENDVDPPMPSQAEAEEFNGEAIFPAEFESLWRRLGLNVPSGMSYDDFLDNAQTFLEAYGKRPPETEEDPPIPTTGEIADFIEGGRELLRNRAHQGISELLERSVSPDEEPLVLSTPTIPEPKRFEEMFTKPTTEELVADGAQLGSQPLRWMPRLEFEAMYPKDDEPAPVDADPPTSCEWMRKDEFSSRYPKAAEARGLTESGDQVLVPEGFTDLILWQTAVQEVDDPKQDYRDLSVPIAEQEEKARIFKPTTCASCAWYNPGALPKFEGQGTCQESSPDHRGYPVVRGGDQSCGDYCPKDNAS